jgi:hypothetical protein
MNAIAKKTNVTASPPDVPVGYADQTPLAISEATPCRSI